MTGVSFEDLLAGLEAKQSGSQWKARCPAHDDGTPSLWIKPGDVVPILLHCFAGCTFEAIVEQLERRSLWPVTGSGWRAQGGDERRDRWAATITPETRQRILRVAERIAPLENTRADLYLKGRGVILRSPTELGYHPRLWHPWTQTVWPGLVAVVRNLADEVVGLHQTYLTHAEPITKPKIDPARATIGSPSGHAIHLAPAAEILLLGEGIETVLSAMQMYRLPGWSAVSAANLPKVILPPVVRRVVLLIDDDDNGTGEKMSARAAQRFRHEGLQVEGIKPDGCKDFNDLLRRRFNGGAHG